MMNILLDKLPDTVSVYGKTCHIRTDFKNWIKFEILMSDRRIPLAQKLADILKLCFAELPASLDSAVLAMIRFYSGNFPENDEKQAPVPEKNSVLRPVYSFKYDADYIYSAFLSQYHIDLQTANLHWWQFKALFRGLEDSCLFVKILGYRSIDLSRIKDKEQKKFYRKMKQIYRLPDERTDEEKEQDMISQIANIF